MRFLNYKIYSKYLINHPKGVSVEGVTKPLSELSGFCRYNAPILLIASAFYDFFRRDKQSMVKYICPGLPKLPDSFLLREKEEFCF
jgi:hypothetical protein